MANIQTFSLDWAGKTLEIEVGRLAQQTNGSCTVRLGDTVVLATVVQAAKARDGIDYFPLLVDFEEKMYAAGKIKGSRFIKREGRASDDAILTARLIDRCLRPMFKSSERRDLQIVLTMLSFDGVNDPDIPALVGSAIALEISDVDWNGPIAGIRLGRVQDNWVVNPTYEDREASALDLILAGTRDGVVMIEAGASQVDDAVMAEAFEYAHAQMQPVFTFMDEVKAAVGKTKQSDDAVLDEAVVAMHTAVDAKVKEFIGSHALTALFPYASKADFKQKVAVLEDELSEMLKEDNEVSKEMRAYGLSQLDEYISEVAREMTLTKKIRVDGRKLDELRPLSAAVALLPRTHGSGLFARGETQALTIATLGSPGDEQLLDTMEFEGKKRYMHHYNFPAFSVGEVRPMRGPGRREIGHGALAEKALEPVLPSKDVFPYTIRLVSEIMSSNGSTSQAAVCGSTLALMDAGVPITDMVAGISVGLMTDPADATTYELLTDIQGIEDHVGDMDFKVAGSEKGITAIQLDIKLQGISLAVCKGALKQAHQARLKILDTMKAAIAEPRAELSQYAPRIESLMVDPSKIRDIIGSGGKTIREITETTGVSIDIEDTGLVMVTSDDGESMQRALDWIMMLVKDVEVGETYNGTVTRLMDFGAFVEVLPGKEGLVHISELAWEHVDKVSDVVNVGDKLEVKVKEIDDQDRVNLSHKLLLPRPERSEHHNDDRRDRRRDSRPPRRDNRDRNRGSRR